MALLLFSEYLTGVKRIILQHIYMKGVIKMKIKKRLIGLYLGILSVIAPVNLFAITNDNGKMWYSTEEFKGTKSSYNIKGYPNGSFYKTTFNDNGYVTVLSVDGVRNDLATFPDENSEKGHSGILVKQKISFISGGNYVKVEYQVRNTNSESKSFSLGSYADVEIGSDDYAPIQNLEGNRGIRLYSGNAQFMFIARDSYGVTNTDTYWLGNYQLMSDRVFSHGTNYESYSSRPGDSAIAYSWKNRPIAPGEIQTYSVVFGVGELNSPPTITNSSNLKNVYYKGEDVTISGYVNDSDIGDSIAVMYGIDGGAEQSLSGRYTSNGSPQAFNSLSFKIPTNMSEGQHLMQIWAVDDKGNMSAPIVINFTVVDDTTPPNGSHSIYPATWTNGNVTINVNATDSQSGVRSITLPNGNVINGSNASYTVSSNGNYSFVLEDYCGNKNNYIVTVSNIDKTAPTATHNLMPAIWTNGNVNINVIANDTQSGIKRIKMPDGNYVSSSNINYTVSSNGSYVFQIEDNTGNIANYIVGVTNIDKVKPNSPTINTNRNWINAISVPVSITGGADVSPGSGLSYYQYKLSGATTSDWINYVGVFNVVNEGTTTITARSVDGVGNISTETTAVVRIDRQYPVNTSITINNNAIHSNSRNVTLSLYASDIHSGVSAMQFRNEDGGWSTEEAYNTSKAWTLSVGDGTRTVGVRFKDLAGNWSPEVKDTIELDTTAPVVGNFIVQGGRPYYNSNTVNIEFGATDNLSGIREMYVSNDNVTWTTMPYTESFNWNLASGDGERSVYIKLVDVAGNMSFPTTRRIIIDKIKPTGTLVISNGNEQTMSRDVKLTLKFADDRSGVEIIKIQEDGSEYVFPSTPTSPTTIDWRLSQGTGLKIVHMVLVDKAGNVSDPISDSIVVDKIAVENYVITDIVNPTVFNKANPFTVKTWIFDPQQMVAGGNFSFAIKLKAPYDASVVKDTITYKVEIIGDGYNKVLTGTMNKQSIVNYNATATLPEDAPKGAKVFTIITASRELLVSPFDKQVVYFPGEEATTKAQIGEISGNIYEHVKFNEIK